MLQYEGEWIKVIRFWNNCHDSSKRPNSKKWQVKKVYMMQETFCLNMITSH